MARAKTATGRASFSVSCLPSSDVVVITAFEQGEPPHRTLEVASAAPTVLVPFASPCLNGARGASLDLPVGRADAPSAPRLDAANSRSRSDGGNEGGERGPKHRA